MPQPEASPAGPPAAVPRRSARQRAYLVAAALLTATALLAGAASAGQKPAGPASANGASIPNLSSVKSQIKAYHDSGGYEADIAAVDRQATNYLAGRLAGHRPAKPAIVLDVDETSLSNYPHYLTTDFGFIPDLFNAWVASAKAPAIRPTVDLYDFARAHGVAVFFVTGRREPTREPTDKNLVAAGFDDGYALVLRPDSDHDPSAVPYKSGARADIEKRGYDVVVNVGDQESDLEGGHADRAFKLPNPMYLIP